MALSIRDLGDVWEALFDVRAKWYDVGLKLRVPDGTLKSIKGEYSNPKDQLRETLADWLQTATEPTWRTLVDALRSRIVGEASLARAIEAQYCSAGGSGQASGKAVSEHLLQQVQKQQGEIEHLQQQLERLKPRDTGATSTGAGRINHPKSYQQHVTEVARQKLLQGGAHSRSKYQQNPKPRISLHWEKLPDAPQEVEGGTAVSQGKMAYFNGYNSTMVYAYNSELRKWSRLPDCPQICFSLVVTVGMLTAVGGVLGEYPGGEPTGILRSLDGRSGTWMKHFPAMPTERQSLVAVCSGQSLIAAGGYQSGICLTTVEVLDIVSLQWFTASSLPQLFWGGTATICGDRLYLLGGHEYSVEVTLSVLFCSLPELLQSCKPQSSEETTVWYRAADTKYYKSAGTTLCGQLLAIGGHVKPRGDTDAIQIYDPTSNSWGAVAGMMPTVRHSALAVALPGNKVMVVGGFWSRCSHVVEIATAR